MTSAGATKEKVFAPTTGYITESNLPFDFEIGGCRSRLVFVK
jgi:hypothetical protein